MQNRQKPDLGPEMPGGSGDLLERFRYGTE